MIWNINSEEAFSPTKDIRLYFNIAFSQNSNGELELQPVETYLKMHTNVLPNIFEIKGTVCLILSFENKEEKKMRGKSEIF